MLEPAKDEADRILIWDAFQLLYMDTDVTLSYDHIVKICSESKYQIDELESILFNEVLPALRFNMYALPAPEWTGFETTWLKQRILDKHRFGRNKPMIGRFYTNRHWKKLKPRIITARQVI